jgi:predicted glycogen debranching enzyme
MSSELATPDEPPIISFGPEICGDLEPALRREWLVTNGLGGYASGTLTGINTRRYHGLLVAALQPPVARTVLVSSLQETVVYDGRSYSLSTHEYANGTIDPQGYRYLSEFRLEGLLPVWVFELGDALLERRVCMRYGANTTYVVYRLSRGSRPVTLTLTPLVTYRDFHSLRPGQGWQLRPEAVPHGMRIMPGANTAPFWLLANAGSVSSNGTWWWNFAYREEAVRGQDDRDDLFAPGDFTCELAPGESCTLALTTDSDAELDGEGALAAASQRQRDLLQLAEAGSESPLARQMVLAADQFLVARQVPSPATSAAPGRTVIAGYHWFNDWGRDTMIALPGLTLATGRSEEATNILRTFARYVVDGLLPNNFPDSAGAVPGYNTADATLWYVVAIYRYVEATGDTSLVDELLPTLCDIVDWHLRGTRYNIRVDAADGLLHAGEPGMQLTWMDAKVDDWVVTPRIGKPVEINALWYNVLRILEGFVSERGDIDAAARYGGLAEQARDSFHTRFLSAAHSWLADVVDGPDGDDWACRPNQIFALALPFPLIEGAEAATMLDAVASSLYTTYGLRSLAPDDPAYKGTYSGDRIARDGAYHQGTAWAWLLGPYVEAHYRVHHDAAAALALLAPFEHHLTDAGLGSISEIFDGDPPHTPRGCIAQAWSVAEILRVWRLLARATVSSLGDSAL